MTRRYALAAAAPRPARSMRRIAAPRPAPSVRRIAAPGPARSVRRIAACSLLVVFAACDRDITAPDDLLRELFDDGASLVFDAAGVQDHGYYLAGLHRLPGDLALSEDQAAAIHAAIDAFRAATQADREALAALHLEARQAHEAGASREEVLAILAQGAPIRERIEAAQAELLATVLAILTPAQKEWLETDRPHRCEHDGLTAEQRDQIAALIAAYEEANRADIEAVREAIEAAHAAQRAGASRAEIHAILEAARPAMERLRAARAELQSEIRGLLSDEQRDSRCFARLTDGRWPRR